MKFSLFITGCQYNYYDATKITRLLTKMGYLYTKDEIDADIIVVLACSVRQKPIDRIYGKIKVWKNSKKQPKIIVVGCVLPRDKNNLLKKVDLVGTINTINKKSIDKLFDLHFQQLQQFEQFQLPEFMPSEAKPDTAYIPIMQGCNNFCTYCAVPYTRGREKSRMPEKIISEIKDELSRGKKHIILLGQNVNSYNPKHLLLNTQLMSFAKLLKHIDKINMEFDYNFMSSNPWNFSQELINTLPILKKWERVLHLPLQSGNNEILRKMNRKYTADQYLTIISNLKFQVLNLSVTTDIIVGFPGETKKQFEDTVKLCEKIGFHQAFVNQYSPRVGTAAEKFDDDVSSEEKKRRWTILNNLINKNHG